jgi:hypothetical protein
MTMGTPPKPVLFYSITPFCQDILSVLLSKSTVFDFSKENTEKQLVSGGNLR